MKQIVQNYRTGALTVDDVPAPLCAAGGVLVRVSHSLVSAGTERMKVGQARMNLLAKARARPDKVRQVVQSVRQVGLAETYQKVRERLEALTPLGYSLAGTVADVGAGVDEFKIGDRVACAGEGIACHAEFVCVPRNLCARVPEGVALEDAAFATVGAIAMNGVRQAGITLGSNVLVVGLGLVGLLAVQILKAAGCRVMGVDLDPHKLELARACGADAAWRRTEDTLQEKIREFTGGHGPDAAYLAASTQSADPLRFAGDVLRERGKVVVVGMMPLEADWRTFYMKELELVMARSYGPGRYDTTYERKGIDYPISFVRWTEQRNLEEFLRLIAAGQVAPGKLQPQTHSINKAPQVYEQLHNGSGSAVALLFSYPQDEPPRRRVTLRPHGNGAAASSKVRIGFIGAGNFATGTLIPALKRIDTVEFAGICSARGLSAKSAAQRHGFAYCASDARELLDDPDVDAVVIATRHDSHAALAAAALRAGKHVFVEKPLALTNEQLSDVLAAAAESEHVLMPGFNRRFSPLSRHIQAAFSDRTSPLEVLCRVNAGALGAGSWYNDSDEGGWRIVSEGCHFIDLIQFLCGCPPVRVHAEMTGGGVRGEQHDNCVVTLRMADGSLGSLAYLANGDPRFDKERIEVFGQGRASVIENFRTAELWFGGDARRQRWTGHGKGHREELAAFIEAIAAGRPSPLPFNEAVATTQTTLCIQESLRSGQPVAIPSLITTQSEGAPPA